MRERKEIHKKFKRKQMLRSFPKSDIYWQGVHSRHLGLSFTVSNEQRECSLLTQFSVFHKSKIQLHSQMQGNIKIRVKFSSGFLNSFHSSVKMTGLTESLLHGSSPQLDCLTQKIQTEEHSGDDVDGTAF